MTIPDDCVQGIILRETKDITSNQRSTIFLSTAVPKTALDDPEWIASPLAAKLGIPLMLRKSRLSESQAFNYGAQLLMLEPNPEDPEFGQSICDRLLGDVVVVRTDGRIVGVKTVKTLVRYLQEECGELKGFWCASYPDPKAKASEIVERLINVEAFERYRRG